MNIENIAKLAQVSKSAVSFALNGKPGVSPETRDKILRIAQEHGYYHKSISQSRVAAGQNRTLRFAALTSSGILTDEYQKQPFFTELIHHIEEQCSAYGYSLLFSSVQGEDPGHEIGKLEQNYETNGLLLLGTNMSREQIEDISSRIPNLLVLDTCYQTLDVDFFAINNMMGAYQAAAHLIDLGHSSIGYVQSKSRMYNFDERFRGFSAAMQEFSLELNKDHIYSIFPTVVQAQNDFVAKIRSQQDRLPTALFCECDYMAISVIKSLTELGIRVPHDIAVAGFDNIYEATIITPELTTVHVEKKHLASLAVQRLIERIEDKCSDVTTKILVDTRLIVRSSTRTAPV
ncbi:LacI family DNA-binding transcriptional regulator [Paenibacillus ferrarius]|uniref:LacI family DNA-binding transcriptional regulator n=1 Tax=Paenibacillus ferrarius TaxID=1469647 RepID=UPI003D27F880